jgi:hypothetical protein
MYPPEDREATLFFATLKKSYFRESLQSDERCLNEAPGIF